MTRPVTSSPPPDTPDSPEASFGHSADGMPVALVGDDAYAMAPRRDGGYYLVTGWRIARPMAEWTRAVFYGHGGDLADESAFRAMVLEQAQHHRERQHLGRRDIPGGASTPWGRSQGGTLYAEGVVAHSAAGHGGFRLSAERNSKVLPMLRDEGGWYEEDACWAIVAITFPDLFTALERRHANDWIVVSAITSEQQKGFVECIATPGGKRGVGSEERRFLVPADEYEIGRFGFVIDPDRHAVYPGPSSFIGWQGRGSP